MARTEKNVVPYFPHDSQASSSDTITVLQSQFGNDGYAVWFKLLEKLASTENHFIDCRNNVRWQLLLAYLGTNEITTVEILKLLVEMQAIDKELWDSKLIWCENLVKNIGDVYKNRRREIPRKPIITSHNSKTTDGNGITTDDNTQSKVKYSKVNNSKVNNNGFILPDWIDKNLWNDFLEVRKKQKAIPTLKAMELLVNDLDKFKNDGDDPNEVLRNSIKNSWKGLFSLKGSKDNGKNRNDPRAIPEPGQYTRPEDLR